MYRSIRRGYPLLVNVISVTVSVFQVDSPGYKSVRVHFKIFLLDVTNLQ